MITVRLGLVSRDEGTTIYSNSTSTGFVFASVSGVRSHDITPMQASDTEIGTPMSSSPVNFLKVDFPSSVASESTPRAPHRQE